MIDRNLRNAYLYWRLNAHCQRDSKAAYAFSFAKKDVAEGRARYPASRCIVYSPRDKDGKGWVENVEENLRVTPCDEVVRIDHKGWFTDPHDGGSTLRGVIVRSSHGRIYPGYTNSDNNGVLVDWSDCRMEQREAARAADRLAERAAEKEREYACAWQAGSHYAYLGETIKDNRRDAIALIREFKEARKAKHGLVNAVALCGAIKRDIRRMCERIAEARNDRAKLFEGSYEPYWFSRRDKTLVSAFNEGAGI